MVKNSIKTNWNIFSWIDGLIVKKTVIHRFEDHYKEDRGTKKPQRTRNGNA